MISSTLPICCQETAILEKFVALPVFLQMDEEKIQNIVVELQAAAEGLL